MFINYHNLKNNMQEIYFFICQNLSNQNKGEKMNTNKINKYLFALGSFVIVIYLAANTSKENNSMVSNIDYSSENDINQIEDSSTLINKEELKKVTDFYENESANKEYIIEDESSIINDNKSLVSINSIKIAKLIDTDESSESYREPINSFKTITTLDENVLKEINYYPEFYVWTSINTEQAELSKIDDQNDLYEFNPLRLSMIVNCNNLTISKNDYQINAKTPRWREWVKIDLSPFESESIIGNWSVKIINLENEEILETRSFTFNKEFSVDEIKQTAEVMN